MKVNKSLLAVLSMFLILLVFVSSASAADSNEAQALSIDESTNIITQNDIYTMNESSFSDLADEIENVGTTLDLTEDYAFNNATDNNTGILISKDNFVLNGNGHTIDGNNQSRIFNIIGNNITLNDLILINGNSTNCGGIRAVGSLTLNNVTFINNYANGQGGAIGIREGSFLISNCRFIDNYAESGSSILVSSSEVKLYNSSFTSKKFAKGSQIDLSHAEVYIKNTTFANITSSYAPALNIITSNASIINSKFIDLKAIITAGAIRTKAGGELYIENCEFKNVTSSKNGGAIFADIAGATGATGNVTIIDTKFRDTYSEFGGAYVQLTGDFVLKNTEFINSHAKYNGGAIYLSYTNTGIDNCTFDSNGVSIIEGYPTYGGAIFSDISTLNITESKFFNNNMASAGNAIYAYDTSYNIKNSKFENNTNPIYTVFDKKSILENNVYINDDNVSTNNTFYATIITGQGLQLSLLNNTINVINPPARFDLRDWGWVSSVKNQGWMGACWTFGMTGTLESALLKAANITTDFSENNMQNTMLQYSIYGCGGTGEFGANILSTAYLLSWLGAFTQDADTYDEVGKISPVITTMNDIHVQDVVFTPNNEIPNGTQLKLAIMKYGSIDVSFFGQSTFDEVNPYYNPETHAQYVNESLDANHDVSIVGWDDNYNASNFLITPPGNGAWIVKNSYSTKWGDNGFLYVSYYDKTLMSSKDVSNYATSIIIENTEPYNKNYQYSLIWGAEFNSGNQSVSYMNEFEALENDAIAAVGTYFNKEGINYTVTIYVNDELKLTQTGLSPYFGYHTIKLNEYIPIRKGDVFKAVITSNAAPTVDLTDARPHYTQNLSFISFDGKTWKDTYDLGYITCLKVYTVALPIYTEDLVKIYKNDSRFEANIGVANETVTFEINGRNYTRVSDENGSASIAINLNPGNYTIKTTFNGTTVENKITVLPTLIGENLVKYYRNASQFYISLIDGEGKSVSCVNITMNINGVFYNRTTNENGTAKLNINLLPGNYILTAIDPLTGLQMSYNVTVLPTMNATDLEMTYKDGSTFNVTVLDGQGNPLKNAAVKFNINGVFYTRYTDSNGIAKLNINLIAGKYIITSEYDNLKIANTITIRS
ncbi:C1 family peptidase [Methanobrevibacter sp.]|uniref:C1 family peptidase n=1 Tax=Methanobrevibacter sp. TaxID=66852 RepID=UPI00388DB8DD